jgi:hypothetical protein
MKILPFLSLLSLLAVSVTVANAQTITYKADTTVKTDTIPATQPEEKVDSNKTIKYYETLPSDRDDRNEPERQYYVKSRSSRKSDIKTISGSVNHSGGFGALSFRATKFRGQPMVLGGVRGGWIVNRSLGIGLEGYGIVPTAKFDDIDPLNGVVAVGGYGGFFLEPIFFSNQVVHITFPVSAGAGWLGYILDWKNYAGTNRGTNISEDNDVFWYVEPGVDLEVNIARNFRLDLGVSKRFTQDLELAETTEKDFNGINYFLTLKIGGF